MNEKGPVVIGFKTETTFYYLDMTYCVSMKITPGKLTCSFADGQKFHFTEYEVKAKVVKAFKQSKRFPEYEE